SLYYDPMIAKLVTHAPTRAAAIAAQSDALDAFAISGIRHNIAFLAALMAHPRWQAGKLSTGFIAEEFPDGFRPIAAEGERAQVPDLGPAHRPARDARDHPPRLARRPRVHPRRDRRRRDDRVRRRRHRG